MADSNLGNFKHAFIKLRFQVLSECTRILNNLYLLFFFHLFELVMHMRHLLILPILNLPVHP